MKNQKSFDDSLLRKKAEASIIKQQASGLKSHDGQIEQNLNEAEMQKLLHELQVYQIELEMQNLELRQAVEEAETATELYDFAPTGYFTVTPDSTISQLNFSGAKMLGQERSKLLNTKLIRFFTPLAFSVFNEFLNAIFYSELKQSCEISLTLPDKSNHFLFLEGIVTKDRQKCQITAVDITERKRMEVVLRESEARFRSTFDQSPVGSVMVGLNSRFIKCNASFCDFVGYSEDELIGKTIADITYPEDRELGMKEMKQLVEGKIEMARLQKRYLRKDGSIVWGELSICVVCDADNKPIYFLPIIQNITERRHSEEALRNSEMKYRRLHETLMDGFVFVDMAGNIKEFNEPYQKMLGYESAEIKKLTYQEITPRKWKAAEKKIIEDQVIIHGYSEVYEKEYIRKGGTIFPVELRTFLVKNENNENEGMWAIVRDITESRKAKQILQENEARLSELNATKDKFFSIIAHDLRSPFNSILGFSNILAEQIKEKNYEGIESYANILQNSAQRALSLLLNLLEWSRSQKGLIKFSPEYVELVGLINEITELLNGSAAQKSISIIKEIPRNVHAFADIDMISTIMRNLISNAIKFTNPGGQIVIFAEQKPDKIFISVSDNGVGIKIEAIGKLFRIDASSSTKGTNNETGSGLGLILCKEFVEKHEGKIWVKSEFGKGSQFCFTIPVKMIE
jgi:PAS domain S-box-containing protein